MAPLAQTSPGVSGGRGGKYGEFMSADPGPPAAAPPLWNGGGLRPSKGGGRIFCKRELGGLGATAEGGGGGGGGGGGW